MKTKVLLTFVLLGLLAVLPGCGGGGEGGGSGSKGVRILNASIDSAPFALSASGRAGEVLQTAKFASPERYFGIPAGEQVLSATCLKGAPVFSFTTPKERPERQTLLVYGSRAASGAKAVFFADDAGEIPTGMSAVRVIHGVEKVSLVDASVGGTVIGDNVSFGSTSPYVLVPSGEQPFAVKEGYRGGMLGSGTLLFQSGHAYSLFASGEVNYLVLVRVTED